MATIAECTDALRLLAARLATADPEHRDKASLDRSLSCTVTDLDVIFAGHLKDGELRDIRQVDSSDAQIRLTLTSDDLLALVNGQLNVAAAWARGRLRIDAGLRDLMRLRTIF